MNEEEKLQKAKQSYEEFLEKMSKKVEEEQQDEFLVSYVMKRNNDIVEDYYWSNEDITPTKLYRWILKYNGQHVSREEWAASVRIPKELYDTVLEMLDIEEDTGVLEMDDVLIMSIEK